MIELAEVLAECDRLGIQLWASGDALRYKAPEGALTEALRETLRAHKAELVAEVRSQEARDMLPCVVWLLGPGDWRIVEAPPGDWDPGFVARHAFYQNGETIATMARRCATG